MSLSLKKLLHNDKEAIEKIVFLEIDEGKEIGNHIEHCSMCKQTMKEIRAKDPGIVSDLVNFGLDIKL